MFASDDVVFAWVIGKALLILIVSCSTLVYAAWWAVTWQGKSTLAQQPSLELSPHRPPKGIGWRMFRRKIVTARNKGG